MGSRIVAAVVVVGTALAAVPLPVRAQHGPLGSIHSTHPYLTASLARVYAGSPTWRQALAAVAATGRRMFVLTPDKVRLTDTAGKHRPFDDDMLAEVHPVADDQARVEAVIVIINVPLLDRLYSDATMANLEADLDRIVAHEVYGHAMPYLLVGNLSGKCADPLPGQRATDACAIKRENEIRGELKLGERRGHGLDGLTLARRLRN